MRPRPIRLAAGASAAVLLLPTVVLLSFWVAGTEGWSRVAALAVCAACLLGLHGGLCRPARRQLSDRELAVLGTTTAGVLASFALALGLTSTSMNAELYELSPGDVGLACLLVLSTAGVVLLDAVIGRRGRRQRTADLPRFAPPDGR